MDTDKPIEFDRREYERHFFKDYPRKDYHLLEMAEKEGLPEPTVCSGFERTVMWRYETQYGSCYLLHKREWNGQYAWTGGYRWKDDPEEHLMDGFTWFRPYVLDCRRFLRRYVKWCAIIDQPHPKGLFDKVRKR